MAALFKLRRSRWIALIVGVVLFGKFARRYRPKCYDNDGYRWWVISRWPFKGYLHGHIYVSGHDGATDSPVFPYFNVTDSEGRDRGHFPAGWLQRDKKVWD